MSQFEGGQDVFSQEAYYIYNLTTLHVFFSIFTHFSTKENRDIFIYENKYKIT